MKRIDRGRLDITRQVSTTLQDSPRIVIDEFRGSGSTVYLDIWRPVADQNHRPELLTELSRSLDGLFYEKD